MLVNSLGMYTMELEHSLPQTGYNILESGFVVCGKVMACSPFQTNRCDTRANSWKVNLMDLTDFGLQSEMGGYFTGRLQLGVRSGVIRFIRMAVFSIMSSILWPGVPFYKGHLR